MTKIIVKVSAINIFDSFKILTGIPEIPGEEFESRSLSSSTTSLQSIFSNSKLVFCKLK